MPELWAVGVDGRGARKLVDVGLAPSWSPKGSRLAFEGAGGIETARPDGTDVQMLTAGPSPRGRPTGADRVLARR
jgi:hypothetical protein